jgi:hypothetical protein
MARPRPLMAKLSTDTFGSATLTLSQASHETREVSCLSRREEGALRCWGSRSKLWLQIVMTR